MICNYCGKEITKNVKYCPHCNAQVLDFEEPPMGNGANSSKEQEDTKSQIEKGLSNAEQNKCLTFGIISIIFSFFSPIVSLILASIGLSEIKKDNTQKDTKLAFTLNLLAIIIASVMIFYSIIKSILMVALGIYGDIIWKRKNLNLSSF